MRADINHLLQFQFIHKMELQKHLPDENDVRRSPGSTVLNQDAVTSDICSNARERHWAISCGTSILIWGISCSESWLRREDTAATVLRVVAVDLIAIQHGASHLSKVLIDLDTAKDHFAKTVGPSPAPEMGCGHLYIPRLVNITIQCTESR